MKADILYVTRNQGLMACKQGHLECRYSHMATCGIKAGLGCRQRHLVCR
jgi:hypothetical protein